MPKRKKIRYSYNLLEYLNNFKKICSNKKVYLYGAGKFSSDLFDFINLEAFNISGFIDGDALKRHHHLKNLTIYSIDEIPELNPDIIVITTKQLQDIDKRLNQIKQDNNLDFEIINDFFEGIEGFLSEKNFDVINYKEIKTLNFIDKEQFTENVSIEKAKELFKKSIQIVEAEPFSFCNRKCWFCPNSFIDRRSTNNIMPEELFLKLVKELREINYNNIFTFTRYNEPLSNDLIYTRIAQTRELLPDAFIRINTNGDYLNSNTAENLYKAGLDHIEVQIYSKEKDESFDVDFSTNKIEKLAKLMNLDFDNKEIIVKPEGEISLEIKYKHSLLVSFIARDMKKCLLSRGGYLDNYFDKNPDKERIEPCYASFISLIVDYNGNVMPCCNLRSDIKEHNKFILGNIAQNSVYEIFTSKKNIQFKKDFLNYGKKPQECKNCNQYLNILEDTPENRDKIKKIREYLD